MNSTKTEVILEVKIEYDSIRLTNGSELSKDSRIGEFSVGDFQSDIENVITEDLPRDIQQIYGLDIHTNIKAVRYGSLSVFFALVFAGVGTLSRYKNLCESVELIREQCRLLLSQLISRKYKGHGLTLAVYTRYPSLDDTHESTGFARLRRLFHFHHGEAPILINISDTEDIQPPRRDAFFWFLLGLCIVLLVLLYILVYRAMVQTYFS